MHSPVSQVCRGRRSVLHAAGTTALTSAAGSLLALASACSMRELQPEFQFTLLDGSRHSSQSLRGRVTLVNFWATTCAICVAEMPLWVDLYHQLKSAQSFELLAVAMSYDPPARVAHYAETRQLPFGVVIDNTGDVARAFGDVKLTPSLFLLDKQGRVAQQYTGKVDVARVRTHIDALAVRA